MGRIGRRRGSDLPRRFHAHWRHERYRTERHGNHRNHQIGKNLTAECGKYGPRSGIGVASATKKASLARRPMGHFSTHRVTLMDRLPRIPGGKTRSSGVEQARHGTRPAGAKQGWPRSALHSIGSGDRRQDSVSFDIVPRAAAACRLPLLNPAPLSCLDLGPYRAPTGFPFAAGLVGAFDTLLVFSLGYIHS